MSITRISVSLFGRFIGYLLCQQVVVHGVENFNGNILSQTQAAVALDEHLAVNIRRIGCGSAEVASGVLVIALDYGGLIIESDAVVRLPSFAAFLAALTSACCSMMISARCARTSSSI